MNNAAGSRMRRASPELVAVVSLGMTILLTVLGQAAWLDGKIERVDARLAAQIEQVDAKLAAQIEQVDAKLGGHIERVEVRLGAQIENLQTGQAAIRERLAALEAGVGLAYAPAGSSPAPADSSH